MFELYENVRVEDVNGVRIAVTEHGPEDGVPVLLIHGFPDSARLWRHQVPVLTAAGYRVLAPDLRGYGRSDKPDNVSEYKVSRMVTDMLTILDRAGIERAHVVGHDWGAAIAWATALRAPDRLRTLTVLSVGHPASFAKAGWAQREKSWYMLLFQFEGVAEELVAKNDWEFLRKWTRGPEAEIWIDDLSRPGALTAALNIYRANSHPSNLLKPPVAYPRLDLPVLGVWSSGDRALIESQMARSGEYLDGEWRYERIEDASHWIPVDAPDRLNDLLLDWLGAH